MQIKSPFRKGLFIKTANKSILDHPKKDDYIFETSLENMHYKVLDLSLKFSGEVNRLRYKDNTQLIITKEARTLINEEDLKSKALLRYI